MKKLNYILIGIGIFLIVIPFFIRVYSIFRLISVLLGIVTLLLGLIIGKGKKILKIIDAEGWSVKGFPFFKFI